VVLQHSCQFFSCPCHFLSEVSGAGFEMRSLVAARIAGTTTFALGSALTDASKAQDLRGVIGEIMSWFARKPECAILLFASGFFAISTVLVLSVIIGSPGPTDAAPRLRIKLVPAPSKKSRRRKYRHQGAVVQDMRRTRRNPSETNSLVSLHPQMLSSQTQWRVQSRVKMWECMHKGSLKRPFSYEDHLRMRALISSQLPYCTTAPVPCKHDQINTMDSTSASGSSQIPSYGHPNHSQTSGSGSSHLQKSETLWRSTPEVSQMQSCGFEYSAIPVLGELHGIDTIDSLPSCKEIPSFDHGSEDDAM